MIDKLKKIVKVILVAYVLVFLALYTIRFVLNQYGVEYRSCVEMFRVFWTYKISFVIVTLILFFAFFTQENKRRENHEQKHFRIKCIITLLAYSIACLFILLVLALGGYLDVPKEEMLESGYLKITEVKGFTAVEYYYCEPISEYIRRPLTYPSYEINPEYE